MSRISWRVHPHLRLIAHKPPPFIAFSPGARGLANNHCSHVLLTVPILRFFAYFARKFLAVFDLRFRTDQALAPPVCHDIRAGPDDRRSGTRLADEFEDV